jgi:DNA helicase-2/ATP-dependent DNA helicase PcrA
MDTDGQAEADAVNIMTLHSAKGLEFDTIFLPGWEEGLFPNQRALDEQGLAGLEEERRLAHVGLTRARRRARIYFATNRRFHGTWSATAPSRFLDELPEANVEVMEPKGGFGSFGGYGGYGSSRFDAMNSFGSNYSTPGWRRARSRGAFDEEDQEFGSRSEAPFPARGAERANQRHSASRGPLTIEGDLVARSTGTVSAFSIGDRVFHQKFGNGNVVAVDGNKLTIQFDKAGEKRVVDSFVERL